MKNTSKGNYRKQEFLTAALELLSEKGYEKTTIQDIIDKMGVSKGAFYHYFISKEDVIEQIAQEYAERGIGIMRRIADRKDLDAIEKINTIIKMINEYKGSREKERIKIKRIFKGDKNLKLERKITKAIRHDALIIYHEILNAAIKEKSIKKSNTRELAEFTANIIHNLNDSIDQLVEEFNADEEGFYSREFIRRLEEKLIFYEDTLSRLYELKGRKILLREAYLERFLKEK